MRKPCRHYLLLSLATVLLLAVGLAIYLGPPGFSAIHQWPWPDYVLNIRVPRILAAGLVGAGLALAGSLLQGLFRNPLADPGLIGVSAGAAVGASLAILLLHGVVLTVGITYHLVIALAACLGGCITVAVVLLLASGGWRTRDYQHRFATTTLLLVGMAVNAMAFAAVGLLSYLAQDAALRDILSWSLGSFEGMGWWSVLILAVIFIVVCLLSWRWLVPLDVLALGEAQARQLGVATVQLRWQIIVAAAVMVGVGVALSGVIGFIGLVAPHMGRLLVGAKHRAMLPLAMFIGAVLLVLADIVARNAAPPILLPVGVITAAVGAPVFLLLLLRKQRMQSNTG